MSTVSNSRFLSAALGFKALRSVKCFNLSKMNSIELTLAAVDSELINTSIISDSKLFSSGGIRSNNFSKALTALWLGRNSDSSRLVNGLGSLVVIRHTANGSMRASNLAIDSLESLVPMNL